MFYGKRYFLTKALISRLYDEAHYLKDLAKELEGQGVHSSVGLDESK